MIRHNNGLRPISVGLLLILVVLLLNSCDKKEETVLHAKKIVVTPETHTEAPSDDMYTEDSRKLPTLKEKYQ